MKKPHRFVAYAMGIAAFSMIFMLGTFSSAADYEFFDPDDPPDMVWAHDNDCWGTAWIDETVAAASNGTTASVEYELGCDTWGLDQHGTIQRCSDTAEIEDTPLLSWAADSTTPNITQTSNVTWDVLFSGTGTCSANLGNVQAGYDLNVAFWVYINGDVFVPTNSPFDTGNNTVSNTHVIDTTTQTTSFDATSDPGSNVDYDLTFAGEVATLDLMVDMDATSFWIANHGPCVGGNHANHSHTGELIATIDATVDVPQ